MRVEGWEQLLYDHIEQAKHATFRWGQNDCALWSADWEGKANGKSPDRNFGADWRGRYATEDELKALMRSRGFETPADIAQHHLTQTPLAFTQRGDVVLHPHGFLGICDGIVSYFLTEKGVNRLHTHRCRAAWKV